MSSMRSRSAELGQAVAALRLFGVDAENAVLIRIEGQRQAAKSRRWTRVIFTVKPSCGFRSPS
jgi:hypothetical protein